MNLARRDLNFPCRLDPVTSRMLPKRARLQLVLAALSVAIATSGSHVIYGLRRQVRKAMLLGQYRLHEKLGTVGLCAELLARPYQILLPCETFTLSASRRKQC